MTIGSHTQCCSFVLFITVCGGACGESSSNNGPPHAPLGACPTETRVGTFEITLEEEFTKIQGKIRNAVSPSDIPGLVQTAGSCSLVEPLILFCDPACETGKTCNADGLCVDHPTALSVGEVSISGLTAEVTMNASPPVFFYNHLGTLPHPAFLAGDAISLQTAGTETVPAFSLYSTGIAALDVQTTVVPMDIDSEISLNWTSTGNSDGSRLTLNLNLAQHGGTPGAILCEIEDTGEFTIPVELTNRLLQRGFSGFPSLTMTRHASDRVDTNLGCVDLRLQSKTRLVVEIPNLVSCSSSDDCPSGQLCQPDLTCG